MAIITISRGALTQGDSVAQKVAQRLGYTCLSTEILLAAAKEFNIPKHQFDHLLLDPPTALDRLHPGQQRHLIYLTASLLHLAETDNIVYHGPAGHILLQGISHVFRVRLIGEMDDRIAETMQKKDIGSDEARKRLLKDDEDRRRWSIRRYGIDPWDCRLYHLVVRITPLSEDDVIDLVAQAAMSPAFQATPDSQARINDLALAARIQANLMALATGIEVCVDQGRVYVHFRDHAPSDGEVAGIKQQVHKLAAGHELVFSSGLPARQEHHINPFHNIG